MRWRWSIAPHNESWAMATQRKPPGDSTPTPPSVHVGKCIIINMISSYPRGEYRVITSGTAYGYGWRRNKPSSPLLPPRTRQMGAHHILAPHTNPNRVVKLAGPPWNAQASPGHGPKWKPVRMGVPSWCPSHAHGAIQI